jgi:hypothetical protein
MKWLIQCLYLALSDAIELYHKGLQEIKTKVSEKEFVKIQYNLGKIQLWIRFSKVTMMMIMTI